jgi:hypothetical protein
VVVTWSNLSMYDHCWSPMMSLALLWNYLCNSYDGYCGMRWYLLCTYYCVETSWFVILWKYIYWYM